MNSVIASGSIWKRYVHLAVPLLLILCLVSSRYISPSFYKKLIIEDGLVEYATAGIYLIAAIYGFGVVRTLSARRHFSWAMFYAVMSVGFLLIALEEISWGQRIFGLNTPEFIEDRNIQGEIGLHNFSGARLLLHPAYMVIGFAGAFGSVIMSPLGVQKGLIGRLLPPPRLFLYFLPCFLFYFAAEIVSPFTTIRYTGNLEALYGGRLEVPQGILALPAHLMDLARDLVPGFTGTGGRRSMIWRHQEPVELLLSLGFLFFVTHRKGSEDKELSR